MWKREVQVFTHAKLSAYFAKTPLIVSEDSPIKVSKLLQDVRSTTHVPSIAGHVHDSRLGLSSLDSVGEFHTNAQHFDIERL